MDWKTTLASSLTRILSTIDAWPELQAKCQSEIDRLVSELQGQTTLVIAGEFKAGKSTFINALLGNAELSADVLPATAVMTKLTYGEQKRIVAHFKNGSSKEYSVDWLPQLTSEREGDQAKLRRELAFVEVQLPYELLRSLHIIDSPGLNSSHEEHTEATLSMLDRADVVFWVFNYMSIGSQTEMDQIQAIKDEGIPVIGIVNGIDGHDEEEEPLERFLEEQARRLQGRFDRLVGVSARMALQARKDGGGQRLTDSGWPQIERLIGNIKQDEALMPGRIYRRLSEVLRQLEEFVAEKKKMAEASELLPMLERFVEQDYPNFLATVEISRKLYEQEKSEYVERCNQYGKPIQSSEDLKQTLQSISGDMEEQCSSLLANYNHLIGRIEEFQSQLPPLQMQSEELSGQWPAVSRGGWLRLYKMQRFNSLLQPYRKKWFKIFDQASQLTRLGNELTGQFDHLMAQFKGHIMKKNEDNMAKMRSIEQAERNRLEQLRENYKKANPGSIHSLSAIFDLQETVIDALKSVFESADHSISSLDGYQRSKYIYENFVVSLPEINLESAKRAVNDLNSYRHQWSRPTSNSGDMASIVNPIVEWSVPALPDKLDYDVDGLIAQARQQFGRFVQRGIAVAIVVGVALLASRSFKSHGDRLDSEDYQPMATPVFESEDIDYYSTAPSMPTPEPEPSVELIPASAYDPEEIFNLVTDMYLHLPTNGEMGDFRQEDYFTDSAWSDYRIRASQHGDRLRTQADISSIVPESTGDMHVEGEEVYENASTRVIDKVIFEVTVRPDQSLVISEAATEFVREEPVDISVDQEAMKQFIQDYRDHYFEALNEDDFQLVSPYLTPDGAAYSELETYTDSISGKGYRFENIDLAIDDIQQTGANLYTVSTNEHFFAYDDSVNQKTEYYRIKKYELRAEAKDRFLIDRIEIVDTQKQSSEIAPQLQPEGGVLDDVYPQ